MARKNVPGATLIVVVPHMDAGDRSSWPGDQDERPLSDLGQRQAEALASYLDEFYDPSRLVASPALRARQTLEPMARLLGLAVEIEPRLAEEQAGESTPQLAERGEQAFLALKSSIPEGAIITASHGDLIPATMKRFAEAAGVVYQPLQHRGQFYVRSFSSAGQRLARREVVNFPR